MGAKVDVKVTQELNRLNQLWKTAYDNVREAQRDLEDGVDKKTAALQKILGETQRLLVGVKRTLNDHASTLSNHSKCLDSLGKKK